MIIGMEKALARALIEKTRPCIIAVVALTVIALVAFFSLP